MRGARKLGKRKSKGPGFLQKLLAGWRGRRKEAERERRLSGTWGRVSSKESMRLLAESEIEETAGRLSEGVRKYKYFRRMGKKHKAAPAAVFEACLRAMGPKTWLKIEEQKHKYLGKMSEAEYYAAIIGKAIKRNQEFQNKVVRSLKEIKSEKPKDLPMSIDD